MRILRQNFFRIWIRLEFLISCEILQEVLIGIKLTEEEGGGEKSRGFNILSNEMLSSYEIYMS